MRIGITVDDGLSSIAGGIGQYVRSLVKHLASIAPDDQFVLVYARARGVRPFALPSASNISWVEIPIPRLLLHRFLWPLLGKPLIESFTGPLDVLHITLTTTRVPTQVPTVVTIYDLFPEKYPDHFKPSGRFFRKGLLKQAKEQAHAIIAISEATKHDIVELLGMTADSIAVIHLGLPRRTAPPSTLEAGFIRRYTLQQPYILFVGRIDPRKNIKALIKAFSQLRRKTKDPYLLVLAGSNGWKAQEVRRFVERLGLQDSVRFLGYVPDEYLSSLMRNATVFAYPSLYEGFGLPLLEAMAYGIPIAASNISSIPEVAGPAANYFDPYDPTDICRALVELVEDAPLRVTLIEEGHRRLANFSWERTAQQTLEVYYRVAGER